MLRLSPLFFFFFLMIQRPPKSTHRYTLFPYTTLFRSSARMSTVASGRVRAWVNTPSSRSEEHTSELQSHSGISYAVFCLKKKNKKLNYTLIKINNLHSYTMYKN